MVDYSIWPWVERLGAVKLLKGKTLKTGFTVDTHPILFSWIRSLLDDPSVQSTQLSDKEHAKFIASLFTGTPIYD